MSFFGAELYCPLCNDLFVEPAVVPCGHSFCRVCILEKVFTATAARCPLCSTEIKGTSDVFPNLTVASCVKLCLSLLSEGDRASYDSRRESYEAKEKGFSKASCSANANPPEREHNDITMEVYSQNVQQSQPAANKDQGQELDNKNEHEQQPSQKLDAQKSPRKAKVIRSSQASPKVTAKKKKRVSPMKTKKQQQQQQQQQQQLDEAVRAQKLRQAIERAKKKGTKFLNIAEPWEDDDKQTFQKGLATYSSPTLRAIYCEMIGLTLDWAESTGVKDMLTAVSNLSLNCDTNNIQELRRVLNEYITCGGQHKISSFFKSETRN